MHAQNLFILNHITSENEFKREIINFNPSREDMAKKLAVAQPS